MLPTPRRRLCGLCVTRSCLSVCCEQDYCKSNHPIWLKLCVAIWPVNRKNWLTDITGNLLAFLMLVSSTRTQLGRRSFHVAAPAVWNALPSHLRSSSINRGQFRAGLKTHLSHRPTDTSAYYFTLTFTVTVKGRFCWTKYWRRQGNKFTTFWKRSKDIRIRIRIDAEIRIQIPDHFRSRLDALAEVCTVWAQSSSKMFKNQNKRSLKHRHIKDRELPHRLIGYIRGTPLP